MAKQKQAHSRQIARVRTRGRVKMDKVSCAASCGTDKVGLAPPPSRGDKMEVSLTLRMLRIEVSLTLHMLRAEVSLALHMLTLENVLQVFHAKFFLGG